MGICGFNNSLNEGLNHDVADMAFVDKGLLGSMSFF
jgi:hypothetical protein